MWGDARIRATPGRRAVELNVSEESMSRLDALKNIVGSQHVLIGEQAQPHLEDWRGRYHGQALAVVRPGSTDEVAELVRWCLANRVPIVPQGGNTGLCGGATPDQSGSALVMSLARLNRVRSIDLDNDTMVVE